MMKPNLFSEAWNWLVSPQRTNSILSQIGEADQKNISIVNIHRLKTPNQGDYYCAPYHYFDELNPYNPLDILDCKSDLRQNRSLYKQSISNNALIIGGGGLLNRVTFEKQMHLFEMLGAKGKKTVLWGIGHNEKSISNKTINYNIDISQFGLAGTRDFSMPGEYVPCASCMHPHFDRSVSDQQEIGIILHERTMRSKRIPHLFDEFPVASNHTPFDELVRFIGRSETIITDSYHVMYWSILMSKKIVAIPNSSKFFDFKYKPLFTSFDEAIEKAGHAPSYSGVLEECRSLNSSFAEKVYNYLGI